MGTRVRALWQLGQGVMSAFRLLRRLRPDAVVATGGFAAAATLAAAVVCGTRFFLLEQNCTPGRVTRFFSRFAQETFLSFPVASRLAGRASVSGCPLRPALCHPERCDDGMTVLVLGGSLGARALNEAVLAAAGRLPAVRFVILAGRRDYAAIRSRAPGANCEVIEFTDSPEMLYRRATVALSRAGGVVLSELAVWGIPAVLIPFPRAADQHQQANAKHFAEAGAAMVVEEGGGRTADGVLAEQLAAAVDGLLADPKRRAGMARAMLGIGRPSARARIAERIVACLAA
jgi:UDP-N-acetylglucosamine--N-acetylmuramyl-(pentapeptide) pyrophosphoryl-undecaprenol N-acetylglucosamine transferase